MTGGEVLLKMAERAGHGPRDLSSNLFDYLYGDKSDYARPKKAKLKKNLR